MNVKTMSIGLLLLAAFSTGLIAQGEKGEVPQRNYQDRADSRDQGLAGVEVKN